jgi:amino acid transporter
VAHEAPQGDKRLAGSLTLIDAIAQSVGFMGPVFSIAFLVPLLVGLTSATGKGAGIAAPLSVIIAAIGVLGLGWIIAQYAKRIHAAGSLYDYVSDGLGARAGTACGILYYVGVLALAVAILVMIGGTVHDTLQAEFNVTPLPAIGWDLILAALLAAVLYAGVALSTRVQLTLALISVVAVLAFFINVIARAGGNGASHAFAPSGSPTGWSGIFFGVLYGVLLFTGFETAANLGEETRHPKRDIPRAILISVLAIAGFYVIGSYAQVAGYHFSLDALGKNAGAPLFGLAGPTSQGGFGSVAVRRLLELVVVLDMIAVMIGASVSAARGLFALGRDGRLPRALGVASARKTPLTASIVVVVADLVVIAVTQWWTGLFAIPQAPHYVAVFSWLAAFGGFALAVIYLLMSVGALRGLRDHERPWAVWLAAIIGIVVTAGAIYGSIYKVTAPTIWAPYAALGVFAVALLFAFTIVRRGDAPTSVANKAAAEAGR